jgi:hypothetical protein
VHRDAERHRQVVHPAGAVARLDHEQHAARVAAAHVLRQQLVQCGRRRRDSLERLPAGRRVHRAADALELAQVEPENPPVTHAILLW